MNESPNLDFRQQVYHRHAKSGVVRHRLLVFGACTAGFLDASVALSFILGMEPGSWYAMTFVIKSLILGSLLASPAFQWKIPVATALFLITVLMIGFTAQTKAAPGVNALVQPAGFVLHFFLSSSIIGRNRLEHYLVGFSIAGTGVALAFCFELVRGNIESVYGRFLYFSGSQPNLGGEIAAITALSACLSMRLNRSLPIGMLQLLCALILQSRAASVVIALVLLVTLYTEFTPNRRSLREIAFLLLTLSLIVAIYFSWELISSRILLLDNEYRGLGSGFVGRFDRWTAGLELFLENPLFGVGLGHFSGGVESPHSFPVLALATSGMLGAVVLLMLAGRYIALYQRSRHLFFICTPYLLMFAMNDRFINLNPFPFVFLIVLFHLSKYPFRPSFSLPGGTDNT